MSEPRDPRKEGGLKRPPQETPPAQDQGLSKTGGGKTRGDALDDQARGGMLGEGEEADHGGMADEL